MKPIICRLGYTGIPNQKCGEKKESSEFHFVDGSFSMNNLNKLNAYEKSRTIN
jgi:hypothetical protein